MKKIAMKYIMASFVLIFASCEKEGLEGPQGEQGIQGPAGQDGEDGTDGVDGNANVIASDWMEATDEFFGITAEMEIPFTGIDSESIENGVLLVYAKTEGFSASIWPSGQTTQLPITLRTSTSTYHFGYFFSSQNIKINYSINPIVDFISFPSGTEFRYVLIPSNSLSGKSGDLNYSKMTYKEVIDHFGLEY